MSEFKVALIGSGNWGSAIAKIIGNNVLINSEFDKTIKMWVFEEMVEEKKLTEIINTEHENVKYLPGHKLPESVVADPDVVSTAADADILIFVIPHQFVRRTCDQLVGKIKPSAFAVSLIKGIDVNYKKEIKLISCVIASQLKIPCSVLMGANIANEVAEGHFCESTLATKVEAHGTILKKLFQTPNFRISITGDVEATELCGALKNVVACAAGFCDGLGSGNNTKAAVIRLGLMEMIAFCHLFKQSYESSQPGNDLEKFKHEMDVFFQSCGVADLVTTCYGGRNRKVSEAFAKTGKPLKELEEEMLGGQRLQGPDTATEVYQFLTGEGRSPEKFPLFTAVYQVFKGEIQVTKLFDSLRNHPEHL